MALMTTEHDSKAGPVLPYIVGYRLAVNLPNSLTLIRIFFAPLLLVVLLTSKLDPLQSYFGVSRDLVGAAVFAIAALTDFFDGYVARRRKQVTGLGQWMDPLADKLLVTCAFVSLAQMDVARAWMVAVILGREFFVTVLRSVAYARGQAVPASPIGKIKMVAQVTAILALILSRKDFPSLLLLGKVALWVALVAAFVSAVDYGRRFNVLLAAKPVPPALAPDPKPKPELLGRLQLGDARLGLLEELALREIRDDLVEVGQGLRPVRPAQAHHRLAEIVVHLIAPRVVRIVLQQISKPVHRAADDALPGLEIVEANQELLVRQPILRGPLEFFNLGPVFALLDGWIPLEERVDVLQRLDGRRLIALGDEHGAIFGLANSIERVVGLRIERVVLQEFAEFVDGQDVGRCRLEPQHRIAQANLRVLPFVALRVALNQALEILVRRVPMLLVQLLHAPIEEELVGALGAERRHFRLARPAGGPERQQHQTDAARGGRSEDGRGNLHHQLQTQSALATTRDSHSHSAVKPDSSVAEGTKPRSARARVVSADVSRMSPF
jgi:CDP-diacylglycerol--glycerol-3-phosphate 3-phosphatidyltransferase